MSFRLVALAHCCYIQPMKKQFSNDSGLNERVQTWWNNNPFVYFVDGEEGTWEFFQNIDRKFLKWHPFTQKAGYPFMTNFVDMYDLKEKKVLDIACGSGVLTEQFVRMGAYVSAIDLTAKAVELTKKRMDLYGIEANVIQADGQELPFDDNSFDLVCAWGCLMHMPKTEQAIAEIKRVLKPGGKLVAMMYHKNSIHLRLAIQFWKGVIGLKYLRYDNQLLINRYTDGNDVGGNALTKFYSVREFKQLFGDFSNIAVQIHNHPSTIEHLPHRILPLGKLLPRSLKSWIAHTWGMNAMITAEKPV
jgi:ubiquinone/menaquinone biosynthesis C-methylase UbiE